MKLSSKEEIYKAIDEADEMAIGALLKIYSFQTSDEQNIKTTIEINDQGFNSSDANILSDISEYFNNKGYLSEKQVAFVRRSIKKYWQQLSTTGFEPVTINKNGNNKEIPVLKTAKLANKKIVIEFSFPKGDKSFIETLNEVKELSGRKFIKEKRHWEIPLGLESVEKLKEWNFDIDSALTKWHEKMTNKPKTTVIEIPGLKKELYPFQKEGVSFIENRNGRALIGDEMGTGKTIQALAYLQLHLELRPAIIVCPASLKLNWAKEIKEGIANIPENNYQILSGKKGFSLNSKGIYIINYDILTNWLDELKKIKPEIVIFDESHFCKSSKSLRSKAALALSKKTNQVICLSGTPIINRPIEFYNTLKMIEPTLYPSRWNYAHKFCGAYHNGFGWNFNGATNTEKLNKSLVDTIMLRRLKKDVLKELPAKVRTVIPIELDNRSEYNRAESDIILWIRENEGKEQAEKAKGAETLVAFEKLKQLAVKGKMKGVIKWIEDFLESDQKLVVFATHTKTIDDLINHFGKITVRLDGSTSQAKRQEAIDKFQTDNSIKLFIGNIKAAGVGINLFAASNVCFLELSFVVGEHLQAEDRIHRIGQKADSVNAYYLLAQKTIEEDIMKCLERKAKILNQILDGKSPKDINIFQDLIKELRSSQR